MHQLTRVGIAVSATLALLVLGPSPASADLIATLEIEFVSCDRDPVQDPNLLQDTVVECTEKIQGAGFEPGEAVILSGTDEVTQEPLAPPGPVVSSLPDTWITDNVKVRPDGTFSYQRPVRREIRELTANERDRFAGAVSAVREQGVAVPDFAWSDSIE